MSIVALGNAASAQFGQSAQLVNTTLHYLDGGRIQLVALTIVDPQGNRQTLTRSFVGNVDMAAQVKRMALDWQSGALSAVVTDGPQSTKGAGNAVLISTPATQATPGP